MESGAITQYVDVAQLVLYLFGFFLWSRNLFNIESKREGFPLESDGFGKRSGKKATGLICQQKIFITKFHGNFEAPHARDDAAPSPAGSPTNPFLERP